MGYGCLGESGATYRRSSYEVPMRFQWGSNGDRWQVKGRQRGKATPIREKKTNSQLWTSSHRLFNDYEIDKSIFFCKYFSLYLRMCIFCSTFEHLPWLAHFPRLSQSQFPRSYVREMQPILQIARNICKNGLTLSSATQHFAFKRAWASAV